MFFLMFTSRWMVPNAAGFIFLHQRRNYPVRRLILLSAFEEGFYRCDNGMEVYRHSPPCSSIIGPDPLRVTDVGS